MIVALHHIIQVGPVLVIVVAVVDKLGAHKSAVGMGKNFVDVVAHGLIIGHAFDKKSR